MIPSQVIAAHDTYLADMLDGALLGSQRAEEAAAAGGGGGSPRRCVADNKTLGRLKGLFPV